MLSGITGYVPSRGSGEDKSRVDKHDSDHTYRQHDDYRYKHHEHGLVQFGAYPSCVCERIADPGHKQRIKKKNPYGYAGDQCTKQPNEVDPGNGGNVAYQKRGVFRELTAAGKDKEAGCYGC